MSQAALLPLLQNALSPLHESSATIPLAENHEQSTGEDQQTPQNPITGLDSLNNVHPHICIYMYF